MRTGNIFVNAFTTTSDAGKIVSGKTENIVTTMFTIANILWSAPHKQSSKYREDSY